MKKRQEDTVRGTVRARYGEIARGEKIGCGAPGTGHSAGAATGASCCGGSASAASPSEGLGYDADELANLPNGADLGLGCGSPGRFASVAPGDVVLDLGSGGGIDCFLAAEQVGATGRVIGVDMTPDMIERARRANEKAGHDNVEFRLGEIENLPVADATVDVIISNCVVNLSPDKPRVFREALRVLKPGGRVAISDILAVEELPEDVRQDLELHAACIAGASLVTEVESMLEDAGFVNIRITPTILGGDDERIANRLASTSIEAQRPQ